MITRDQIAQTAHIVRQDPAYIQSLKNAMLDTGLAGLLGFTIDEGKLDPFRPCPSNWKAMQIAVFDNGEIVPGRNRPKIQKTKMRFGLNLKVWTRDAINFSNAKHIAWQANAYLWTADEARQIVRDLRDEGYVDMETVDLIETVSTDAADDLRFSVPLLKLPTGTRWMREHVIISKMKDDQPASMIVAFPGCDPMATTEPLVDWLADGKSVSGNTILQARLARDPSLGQWATQIIE